MADTIEKKITSVGELFGASKPIGPKFQMKTPNGKNIHKPKNPKKPQIKKGKITEELDESKRVADSSLNGYVYQRLYGIDVLLDGGDFEYLLEEGKEDIDLIRVNGHRKIIQVKYYAKSGDKETLSYSTDEKSGLYKVIESNIKHENIDEIIMCVYNGTHTQYTEILSYFVLKEYGFIAKLFLLLTYKVNSKNESINVRVNTNKKKINELYKDHYDLFKNHINSDLLDLFTNESKYTSYLSKFQLNRAPSYEDLLESINKKIRNKYLDFIEIKVNYGFEQTDAYKVIKCSYIRNFIHNKLECSMFVNKTVHDRRIHINGLFSLIDIEIEKFKNGGDLCVEYLRTISEQLAKNKSSADYSHLYEVTVMDYDLIVSLEDKKQNIRAIINCMLDTLSNKPSDLKTYVLEEKIWAYIYTHMRPRLNEMPYEIKVEYSDHMAYILRKDKSSNRGCVSYEKKYLDFIYLMNT
jgi:hypothetical protein